MAQQLRQPIEYRVDLMAVRTPPTSIDQVGLRVYVLRAQNGGLCAVAPEDTYNMARLMAEPGAALTGIGIVVEDIGISCFVAWRNFTPVPELLPLTQ